MNRRAGLAIAGVLVLALGACGVAAQGTPQVFPPEDVPFGLLVRDEGATTTTVSQGGASVVVYFVGSQGLAAAIRDLYEPASPEDALAALVSGPTAVEARAGLRSALVPDVEAGVSVRDGTATVALDPEFLRLSRVEQALAVAQVVYTLTEFPEVVAVRFRVDGAPLAISVRDGAPTTGPIGRPQVVIPLVP